MATETAEHAGLKRLAIEWARAQGYTIAAPEVPLPNLRFRVDVAAYRPATTLVRSSTGRNLRVTALGTTAIFECKQSRADFLTDSRRSLLLTERLKRLHARKERHETLLKLHYPSLRNGDSLFAEFETHDFAGSGDELYLRLLTHLSTAARQLHAQTKFEKLCRWQAANLHYVVAPPGLLRVHELPDGWGHLELTATGLRMAAKPLWHEVPECARLLVLQRIALTATRGG